ncbi:MAG TPA: glutathione S-transferase family protein [Rhizomicrobium sp.]|jgi:glutathione S-transferase
MSLRLHFHPLSSFAQKVLVALYENDTPFEPKILQAGDEGAAAELRELWPIGKFPVLQDLARDSLIPESTIIIEYLAQYFPGNSVLIPTDADLARQTRLRDRFFDLYVNMQMQKIIGDRLRPAGQKDPFGTEEARKTLQTAYGLVDSAMAAKHWATGDTFSMADCAAAPALFYADLVEPFRQTHVHVAAYLDRLLARPSFARAFKEAEPYRSLIPK